MAGSDHYFHASFTSQNNFQVKITVIAPGLAEGIIDDTCLVVYSISNKPCILDYEVFNTI